jgi:hypothetical protein
MWNDDENEQQEKPHEFQSHEMMLLTCTPGDADYLGGMPISIITLMEKRTGSIQPIMLTLEDSRKLAVLLLASLYSSNDEFAGEVLERSFPVSNDGYFSWPKDFEANDW